MRIAQVDTEQNSGIAKLERITYHPTIKVEFKYCLSSLLISYWFSFAAPDDRLFTRTTTSSSPSWTLSSNIFFFFLSPFFFFFPFLDRAGRTASLRLVRSRRTRCFTPQNPTNPKMKRTLFELPATTMTVRKVSFGFVSC